MKTGIITLVGNNYGNRLQNYAVQELLKEYGDVYTVKQEKKVGKGVRKSKFSKLNPFYIREAINSRLLNIYYIRNNKKGTISKTSYFLKHRNDIKNALNKRNLTFKKFDEQYIQYEPELLHLTGDDTEQWVLDYDAWVCGSDQIWNPTYPTATRNAFLQFASQERRIALSASIGLSDVNDMPEEYKQWLDEIPYISVRENAAANIVKQLTGKDSNVFLDPTMILPKEKWEVMAEQAENNLPKKYALGYFLGIKEKSYDKYISDQLKQRQLPSVELLNGEYTQYLSLAPDSVVDAIRNAEVVYTDSFHGAVFSILFHKQFVVFTRKEAGKSMNSRLETLLSKFHLEDRIYTGSNHDQLLKEIDYSHVDEIIKNEQLKVKQFLDHAFNEIKQVEKQEIIKEKYIKINRKDHCFGCSACAQSCPIQCITMKEDEEGFLYPSVDTSKCIGCSKCISVCPYNERKEHDIQSVYAAINKNEDVRKRSSSGGTFYEIAKKAIEKNGVVYGCAWDENMVARHIRVDSLDEIVRLQGSKYVQSQLDDTFVNVKKDLLNNTYVVFTGTPCQVSGLKNYLNKDYDNLLLIDVLCHGVPSPKVLREYIKEREQKFGSKIVNMNLRDKKKSWHRLHTNIEFKDGKNYFVFCGYDKYMSMFLNNTSLRPSCFNCKFTSKKRPGDITLGDFWGIGKHMFEMDDDKGTSMISVNTDKGRTVWDEIKNNFTVKEATYEIAESGNKVLSTPTVKNVNRDNFYDMFVKEGYKASTDKYVFIPSIAKQRYYDFRRIVLDFVRFVLKKKY